MLTTMGIHGSSVGVYHQIFYGTAQRDNDLILNQPVAIRSDEWLVTSQKTIAQQYTDFKAVNTNVGNGEDQTLLADVPARDWTTFFKPHNVGFFVLPFENAFALRWWSLSYFLVLSCYFFVLALLPRKRGIASLLSLAFVFNPFLQWWYAYGTFASIYYCLFGVSLFIGLLKSTSRRSKAIYSLLLTYVAVSFALVLYPPFQIPCLLVSAVFCVGYFIENRRLLNLNGPRVRFLVLSLVSIVIVTGSVVSLLVYLKRDAIITITNTDYPGQRVITSGGYDLMSLATSHTGYILQDHTRVKNFQTPTGGSTNQSELSNFILIAPFILVPVLILTYRYRDFKPALLITLYACLAFFVLWMSLPGIELLGKLTLLDKVPHQRLLIGLGLLNLFILVSFIAAYEKFSKKLFTHTASYYSIGVLIVLLLLNFYLLAEYPGFISYKLAIALAIPIPVILWLLLTKRFLLACLGLLALSVVSTYRVNPLYRGLDVVTQTPLAKAIRELGRDSNERWVSEGIYIENFAAANGEPSLSGTYLYPQLELWGGFNKSSERSFYNRYAHIDFAFDRDLDLDTPPTFRQLAEDQLNILIEPCDDFFAKNNVGYLITSTEFAPEAIRCATLVRKVPYPATTYYIYRFTSP